MINGITEKTVKYLSLVVLVGLGTIMIYEGVSYIALKQKNSDVPDTIYAAAVLAIFIGLIEIVFGIAHLWF